MRSEYSAYHLICYRKMPVHERMDELEASQ